MVHIAERPLIVEHVGAIHWCISVLGKAAVLVPNDNGLVIAKLGGERGSHEKRHRARAMDVDLFLAHNACGIDIDIWIYPVSTVSFLALSAVSTGRVRIVWVNNEISISTDLVYGRIVRAILKGDSNSEVRGEGAVISLLADLDDEGIGNVTVLEEVTTTSTLAVATIFLAIDVELVTKRLIDALSTQAGA